jgi:hypothetical protein
MVISEQKKSVIDAIPKHDKTRDLNTIIFIYPGRKILL